MTIKEDVKEIWKVIGKITEGMEELTNNINRIHAYNILRIDLEQKIKDEVKEQLKELGLAEAKDFTNYSKSIV